MKPTKLILTGGFLGAGKTTLLWSVAQKLMGQGLRVGIITNDQASGLVDSTLLSLNGLKVEEVSGSCFCCNFDGFTAAIRKIRSDMAPDVIIAEPVGSSTDLSATVIQPLKQYWDKEVILSPFSVLADPSRLESILDGGYGGLHPDAAYIYHKQLEESDIILINKADLLRVEKLEKLKQRTAEVYPLATVCAVSALSGEGIEEWLEKLASGNNAGGRLADVDYDIYANGETALGWLNGTVDLCGDDTDWDSFTHSFLTSLSQKFDEDDYSVGHVKVIIENGKRFVVGNITGRAETLSLRGSAGNSENVKMIVNARVETTPRRLDKMVRETLYELISDKYATDVLAWKYLQPGFPLPTHRFADVV